MTPMAYYQKRAYRFCPPLYDPKSIERQFGKFEIGGDQDELVLLDYNHSMDLSIFKDCKTVADMVPIVHESLEKKSKEDQERAQWNYCFFLVVGCIIAFTVMWYAKT